MNQYTVILDSTDGEPVVTVVDADDPDAAMLRAVAQAQDSDLYHVITFHGDLRALRVRS